MAKKEIVYKNKWIEGKLNKKFWREVLVGRKIVSILWTKEEMTGFILDNGEVVSVATIFDRNKDIKGTLSIQVEG